MRLFWRLVRQSFRLHLTYRAANMAGLATNFFFGLLRAAVLVALYDTRTSVEGLSLQDVVTYTGLTQASIAFSVLFGWYEVMDSVYTGAIAVDLLKPTDLFVYWLARDLGRAGVAFLLRGVTIMVGYAIVFDIAHPVRIAHWFSLALALLLGLLVSFSWRFLINLGAFWIPDARGLGRFIFGISWFTSGFLMPLRFTPAWFQRACAWTPFPSVINTPVEVYLGVVAGPQLARALLTQAAWIVGLVLLGRLVMRAGIRHLVIQGG